MGHAAEPRRETNLSFHCLVQDEYADSPGSVITADFYHANALLPLSDDAIIAKIKSHMEVCEPAFIGGWRVQVQVLSGKGS